MKKRISLVFICFVLILTAAQLIYVDNTAYGEQKFFSDKDISPKDTNSYKRIELSFLVRSVRDGAIKDAVVSVIYKSSTISIGTTDKEGQVRGYIWVPKKGNYDAVGFVLSEKGTEAKDFTITDEKNIYNITVEFP